MRRVALILVALAGAAAAAWYWFTKAPGPAGQGVEEPSSAPAPTIAEDLREQARVVPDDQTLVDRVESQVFRDRHDVKGRVNVNAEHGRVVLRGELESPEQIDDLVGAVRSVDGVRDVESLLHVPGTEAPMHS
jgi:osmotically-inducible protein OsmY